MPLAAQGCQVRMAGGQQSLPQTLRAQQHSVADSALSETQIPGAPGSPQSEEAASGSGLSGHHSPVRIHGRTRAYCLLLDTQALQHWD